MQYNFEYAGMVTYTGQHLVEDISDCALELKGSIDRYWYLMTETELGETKIYYFGPYEPNEKIILPGFIFKYDKIMYSEKKIITKIDKYLNNGEVMEINTLEKEELLEIMEELKHAKYC